ncbi:MAG: DnaJ domain-containing protein [Chloroflexota bacterium]|nr:DnaJ domain-containing protein [Chloroflexota bacterium]
MATVQFKDYYQTLGLARDADEKAIRAAYRKLARQHHPDLNPNDPAAEERFKEVNEAYEVLTDGDKRKLYDRFGEDWQRYRDAGFTGDEPAGRAGGRATFDPNDFGSWYTGQSESRGGRTGRPEWEFHDTENGDDGAGFSDFFQTLFGARGRASTRGRATASFRQQPRRGEDAEVAVEVTFDEAFHGTNRTVQLQTRETCPTCNGLGLVRETTCPTCDGTGIVTRTKTLEVTIPPGVATGSRIRVAGQGNPGVSGGPNGDVYLRTTVRPDSRFERDGDELRTEVEIPLTTAVLGGETVIPTPTGRVALTIPAETQPGRLFRLRGLGMPRLKGPKGQRGDLLARTKVSLPVRLNERERELFEELQRLQAERAT